MTEQERRAEATEALISESEQLRAQLLAAVERLDRFVAALRIEVTRRTGTERGRP